MIVVCAVHTIFHRVHSTVHQPSTHVIEMVLRGCSNVVLLFYIVRTFFFQTDQLITKLQVVVVTNFIRMFMRNVFVNGVQVRCCDLVGSDLEEKKGGRWKEGRGERRREGEKGGRRKEGRKKGGRKNKGGEKKRRMGGRGKGTRKRRRKREKGREKGEGERKGVRKKGEGKERKEKQKKKKKKRFQRVSHTPKRLNKFFVQNVM